MASGGRQTKILGTRKSEFWQHSSIEHFSFKGGATGYFKRVLLKVIICAKEKKCNKTKRSFLQLRNGVDETTCGEIVEDNKEIVTSRI